MRQTLFAVVLSLATSNWAACSAVSRSSVQQSRVQQSRVQQSRVQQSRVQQSRVQRSSAHYRQHQDYDSLMQLVSELKAGRSHRLDVERLLGAPTYCPTDAQCYYVSDRSVPVECPEGATLTEAKRCQQPSGAEVAATRVFPLTLVVQYAVGKGGPSAADQLASFAVEPVGE